MFACSLQNNILTIHLTGGENISSVALEAMLSTKENSNISRFMVPREVVVVKELPKTSTGKIQKNVLREWAKKGSVE